jgi:drug/metabolite transporter (DMT)-like permease
MVIMSETWKTIFGFSIGVGAYTAQSIGKGFHKLGINKMMLKDGMGNRLKQSGTWIMGTVLMAVYMVSQWIALLLVPVNMIAPLDGLSLVVLLLFSRKVLKEPITASGILGAALVIAGTVMSALAFEWNASTVLVVPDHATLFLVNLIIPIVGYMALAITVGRGHPHRHGDDLQATLVCPRHRHFGHVLDPGHRVRGGIPHH